MKLLSGILVALVFVAITWFAFSTLNKQHPPMTTQHQDLADVSDTEPVITPIQHASFVMEWNNTVIYVDPAQGSFDTQPQPDIVFITDVHGDHLNLEMLISLVQPQTRLIAPQVVADELEEQFGDRVTVMSNGDNMTMLGFDIEAVPMYNVPESNDAYHVKGRGNGYIIEHNNTRVYVAGDTGNTPEMRALQDIDIAFVPMNMPYTMTIEDAADAVLTFSPTIVYPYHYRGSDGLSDVARFKSLVEDASETQVRLGDWYSQ